MSNAYSTLPHFSDPLHTTEPITTQEHSTTLPSPTATENKSQRKMKRRLQTKQLLKQQKHDDDALLDYHITWAEDERTEKAKKLNNTTKGWKKVMRQTNMAKPSVIQRGRNAAYRVGTTLGRALSSCIQPNKKRVQFAKERKILTFHKTEHPIWITYDSGADGHYLTEKDRKAAGLPILRPSTKRVSVADGGINEGVNATRLPFQKLSPKAAEADTFDRFQSSLMSVGKTSDDGTISVFTKTGVTVHKEDDVLITCKGKPILIGVRDNNGRYRIPLMQQRGQWQPRRPSKKAKQVLRQANNVYDLPSTEQAIKWMHAVCGFPVKSTWLKAIKAGNYVGWPMLTVRNVQKYYPETNETPKGHMNQSRQNQRSTKAKPMKEHNSNLLKGKKAQDVYTKVYNVRETIFSDQTGKFPVQSRSGNKYIMVMVEIDSNAILVEPMKIRKDEETIRAYNALMLRLSRAGIKPKKHVLDNEVSENMKNHIRDTYKLQMELVPPGCHRRNAAEVAIRNFKAHFLSVLAGAADDFPLSLWDRLLPQTEITLNLIRQSNAIPTVSAYAHLSGPFDYNKMPLAPMGCDVQIHEKTDNRGTWAYHSIDGWYIRTSDEHYRTHACVTKTTKTERLTDTIQFNHKRITNPTITHADKMMKALSDSINAIGSTKGHAKQQMKDLTQMMKDAQGVVKQYPERMSEPIQTTLTNMRQRVQRVQTPMGEQLQRQDDGVRVTRSMTRNTNNTTTSNTVTQPPPRVATSRQSGKRLRRQRRGRNETENSGPASRTRAQTAIAEKRKEPPAANTRAKAAQRISHIPTGRGQTGTSTMKTKKKPPPSKASTRTSRIPKYQRQPSTSRSKTTTKGIAEAVTQQIKGHRKNRRLTQRIARLENEVHQAMAVMDKDTGKMLNYRQLMRNEKYREVWSRSSANEFGRLANGVGGRIKNPTNTIKFIHERDVPTDRRKDVTYGSFVCSVRPEKKEQERTRFTVGGDRINYPGEVATPTADMLVAKMLMNSVVSTKGARFMTMDISNFYLMTPLKRPEFIRIKISDIPDEIIKEYKLHNKVTKNGSIYIQANRGMYGLPQSGLLAQELLEKRLNKHGYHQSKLVPGLWKHNTRPIQFTLVVDDFGVKYVGKEHALHLKAALEENYTITEDWTGGRYIGITLDWDYEKRQVHLSMPNYIGKALKQFQHIWNGKKQHAPYPSAPINYGAKKQYATQESSAPALPPKDKKFIQQVCGKFLFLGRAVDSTLLCPISAIASQSANPTEDTMKQTHQLLNYLATQEEAIITYNASEMVLAVHSDASYLCEPKARSRAGGHFFLSNNSNIPPNNGAILNIAHIIKHVMTSATEAELAALYIMARESVYIRIILEEMGHKQPPTPLQTDNTMADGVINGKIQPKRTKAMDMRFHWLRDRECQQQFRIYWRPGKMNYADYWTKHHAAKHHQNVRKEFLTPHIVLEMLRQEQQLNMKTAKAA